MIKRKEAAVRHNPGIAKQFEWNSKTGKWVDTGKYRSTRRIKIGGRSKRETCFFDNIEDAKSFRVGLIDKTSTGGHHKSLNESKNKLRFAELLQEWKDFHYLTVDYSTKQTYERKLSALGFLNTCVVEEITPEVIDRMIKHWHTNYPKSKTRQSFEKELDALKVVLNFYRRRKDPRFPVPIYREHYLAATVVKKAKQPVRSLQPEDLGKFLNALKAQKNPLYFPLALAQFGLGLRIGEACGLHWDAIDLKNGRVTIDWTVVWDHENWQPFIKERPKNGCARVLAIPEILKEELAKLKALKNPKVDLVFHADGRPLIRKSIGQAYNRAIELCEIKYVSGTHLMRKTSATQANRITKDFWAVSKNLGHSNIEETQKYVEELDEDKVKVAKALDQVARSVLEHAPGPQ